MKKHLHYIKWDECRKAVEGVRNTPPPDRIITIHRGGLALGVMFSHKYKVPLDISYITHYDKLDHLFSNEELLAKNIHKRNILIVDDISDTGHTLSKLYDKVKELSPNLLNTFTYAIKTDTSFTPDFYSLVLPEDTWAVFPWEII